MSGYCLEPKECKAPSWMTPDEKRVFRRILQSEINQNRYVSQAKFDEICDYVNASTRLEDLRARLATEIAANSPRDVDKARIISLNASINSLAAQRSRLAAAL